MVKKSIFSEILVNVTMINIFVFRAITENNSSQRFFKIKKER